MWRKIEALRKQPKEVRNRYAFWYAFIFTAVVAVFWVSSMPARVEHFTSAAQETEKIDGGFARMWQNMKASVIAARAGVPTEEPVTEVAPATHTITAEQFMASSTPPVPKKEGKPILIGTSTTQKATSTTR